MTCLALSTPRYEESSSDTGLSPEADKIRLMRSFEDSPSFSVEEPKRESLDAFVEAIQESLTPQWKAQGWLPIEETTARYALHFLRILPRNIPNPEIAVHPDGEIVFEWLLEPRKIVTISLNSSGRMSYAGLFGQNKTYGTEYFADSVPPSVMRSIRRLFLGR